MLAKKLFRTILKYKAQFISMIIMIAIGVGVFVGFNMEWYSLDANTKSFMQKTGFADYRIVSPLGFSEEQLNKVLEIDGINDASRFVSVNTTIKGTEKHLAVTVTENENVSGVYLSEGKPYDKNGENELWLSDLFAQKNGYKIGDELTLTYSDIELKGNVVGLVKSGEYLICLPDASQVMPDYNTYGFVYVSPNTFKNAMSREYFPQINVLSNLAKKDFVNAIDKKLGVTYMVIDKELTVSYSESQGEVNEGKVMGSILPVLFLAIAVLTMVTTMHRLTASEKTQIGTFKALGFKNSKIIRHYSLYALAIGVLGSVLGIGIGYLLGWYIMNPMGAMGTYIDMPDWSLKLPVYCWLILVGIIAFLTLIGFLSVKSIMKGTPADTLRPYSPKKVKKLFAEKTVLWQKLKFGTRWNLRDCFRHKSRTFMTLIGIIGCMVLCVGALGMQDTMDKFVNVFYNDAINYQSRINIDDTATSEDINKIIYEYGTDYSSSLGVQLEDKTVQLEIYHIENDSVKFVNETLGFTKIEGDVGYVCSRIAKEFNIGIGDDITFSPYGSDKHYTVKVGGIIRSMIENIVINDSFAEKLGIDYSVNTVYTDRIDINVKGYKIANVQTKSDIIKSFDTFMQVMRTMVVLLIVAAIILGIVVLYNLGIMSYTERYREMATLKVVGFKDDQIGKILIGQNLWLTILGVIIGLPAGIGVLKWLIDALASEYEMVLSLGYKTFLISIVLTFGVSLLVGLLVSKKNKKINMVESLKGQE